MHLQLLPQPISQRKKSHELNAVRSQYQTDEDRIKKLTGFSMSKQIEKQRHMSIGGRDDPSNVLGYQKMRTGVPATMRHGSRQKRGQLDPLKDRRVVLTAGKDEKPSALQNNIYGMLSDLNRAKNMRIANQLLREQ